MTTCAPLISVVVPFTTTCPGESIFPHLFLRRTSSRLSRIHQVIMRPTTKHGFLPRKREHFSHSLFLNVLTSSSDVIFTLFKMCPTKILSFICNVRFSLADIFLPTTHYQSTIPHLPYFVFLFSSQLQLFFPISTRRIYLHISSSFITYIFIYSFYLLWHLSLSISKRILFLPENGRIQPFHSGTPQHTSISVSKTCGTI